MRKRPAATLGLIVILAAASTACGSSSKNNATGSGSTTPTSASGGGGGGGSDDFAQLIAQASKAKIKITYTQSDGDSVTIAQDGNGKSSYTTGNNTVYTDANTTVSCDGTGSDAKCTEVPVAGLGGSLVGIFTQIFAGLTHLDSSVYGGHVSSDTIAGRDARCVTFKASDFAGFAALGGANVTDPDAQATICVDKDTGFLLKLESKSGSSTKDEFLATSVGEPSASDFTPPATPETIPSISIPNVSIPNITLPTIPQ